MIIKNGFVLDKSFRFVKTDVAVKDGKIAYIGCCCGCDDDQVIDAEGKYVIPGLVDVHTHGCGGADACDGTREAMETLSLTQGKAGITSFCATTMTLPVDQLVEIMTVIGEYAKEEKPAFAHIVGINMEGPFFNASKKGAQRGDCLLLPSAQVFRKLNAASGGIIKLVSVAPELEGSIDFIHEVKGEVRVSLGHTAADYAQTMEAIENGASHITHLFNAMNSFTHRAPGPIGAAADTNVVTELISDGIHIDGAVIRAAFKLMDGRVNLISDSMSAAGMPNGEYELGGQKVFVKDKKATLIDGTIAGSSTNLMDCVRKAVSFGVPLATAVKSATYIPAKEIGLENKIGSIDVNLDADILVLDRDLALEKLILKGEVR